MAITPEMKIFALLKEYPQLLDVLAEYTPAFSKLRNPILRRTFGRVTTLAQAAAIGGVDLAEMLRTLRQAAGEPEPSPGETPVVDAGAIPLSAAQPEPPDWWDAARVTAEFDARPLHATSENPLPPIQKAADSVPEGGIFLLRNPFEPLPLYEVLGKRGFVPWARPDGHGGWEVYFYRQAAGEVAEQPQAHPLATGDAPTIASLTIDVSELVPPEPMTRVLEALAGLRPGDTLLVHHARRPMYLYAKLEEMGHSHETWELGPNRVDILIRVGGQSTEREAE